MRIPEEFRHLAHCMHQDIVLDVATEHELVDQLVRCLTRAQREVVKHFLTELLATNPSEEELGRIWDSTGPDWGFTRGTVWFFTALRDRIEEFP